MVNIEPPSLWPSFPILTCHSQMTNQFFLLCSMTMVFFAKSNKVISLSFKILTQILISWLKGSMLIFANLIFSDCIRIFISALSFLYFFVSVVYFLSHWLEASDASFLTCWIYFFRISISFRSFLVFLSSSTFIFFRGWLVLPSTLFFNFSFSNPNFLKSSNKRLYFWSLFRISFLRISIS